MYSLNDLLLINSVAELGFQTYRMCFHIKNSANSVFKYYWNSLYIISAYSR